MTTQKLFCLVAATLLTIPVTSTAQETNTNFNELSQALAADGLMLGTIEWITASGSDKIGRTVHFVDRGDKKLEYHFVPNDPRRGSFSDITYLVDLAEGDTASGLVAADTQTAIDNAMTTWNGVKCSAIPLTNFGGISSDLGYVQWVWGYGGTPAWLADITHAGWVPAAFFDRVEPGGSAFILAATITGVFPGADGLPSDINNDGRGDVAFREIYYNDSFAWAVNGDDVDVESIALHEAGHALSQAHFGAAFTTENGKLKFSPRAVMNAVYSGIQQNIRGTDNGGHCGIWDGWPDS